MRWTLHECFFFLEQLVLNRDMSKRLRSELGHTVDGLFELSSDENRVLFLANPTLQYFNE